MQIFSPIKQRILHFADSLNISKRDFYKNTGISRGTLESKTGITEDTITKVFAAYQNLSPLWLITGEGSMLTNSDNTNFVAKEDGCEYKNCKFCHEKDRTIHALEKAVDALEKINHSLEKKEDHPKEEKPKDESFKQTG